jgi:hypothetical protein
MKMTALFSLSLVLFFAAVLAFEIMMLVHVIKNKNISSDRRLLWILGMLFIHPVVAIAYFFTDYKNGA